MLEEDDPGPGHELKEQMQGIEPISSYQSKSIEDKEDVDEYPSGTKLAFIVLALILSIFLASLDMV